MSSIPNALKGKEHNPVNSYDRVALRDHTQECHVKGVQFLTACYATAQLKLPLAVGLVSKPEPYAQNQKTKTAQKPQSVFWKYPQQPANHATVYSHDITQIFARNSGSQQE